MVRTKGLEPSHLTVPDPKSGASAIPPRAHDNHRLSWRLFPLLYSSFISAARHLRAGERKELPTANGSRIGFEDHVAIR